MTGSSGEPTVGALLGACLRELGATRVFGSPAFGLAGIEGLAHVVVSEPDLAATLADAAGRIGPGPGVAALPGGVLRITAAPGAEVAPTTITDPAGLPLAVAEWAVQGASGVNAAIELQLELELDSPAPAEAVVLRLDPTGGRAMVLDETLRELGPVILAGPGVVRAGKVEALRAVAAKAACGVVNTWGAKGLFAWDSPHHFGTAGLQARDFELAGVRQAQLVIAVGLDLLEAPTERWSGAQVLEVDPGHLDLLTTHWSDPTSEVPPYPPLYTELAAALRPLYASTAVPLTPARAAADLAAVRPAGALVAADPGPAGLWVARAFPTTELGSVIVPSRRVRGFAAAAGLVSSLDGRTSVSVVHDPVDAETEAIWDLARAWEAALVLEVWGDDAGPASASAADLSARRSDALQRPQLVRVPVPVDFAHTRTLVEVAGEVVAWQ